GSGPENMIVERDVVAYLSQKLAAPRVTPVAQRMAAAEGVDLSAVSPAKAHVITRSDVETALRANHEQAGATIQPSSLPSGEAVSASKAKLSPTRRTIARRMLAGHQDTAPVTYMRDADATRLVKLRRQILDGLPGDQVRPTYTDLLIKIACHTLVKHPEFNATLEGEELSIFNQVDIALAIDLERGLIAPVIRDAGSMGVTELAQRRTRLLERAKSGALTPEELSGGTFTLSNLGTLGIDHFTPILNAPQVAILGIGRIREIPAAHKGKIKIRSLLGLSLTCDHRVIDGGPAARFLDDITRLVENPGLIWA
ncbi:MAG: dihydrolipoamide acetyltransferase family protein, partial [Omnitrophica WOR_2 bacterium]